MLKRTMNMLRSILPAPRGGGINISFQIAEAHKLKYAHLSDVVENKKIRRKRAVFQKAMRVAAEASEIVSASEHPDSKHHIRSFINAFGRRLQYAKLTECLFAKGEDQYVHEPEMFVDFNYTRHGSLEDIMERIEYNQPIEISNTIILPWPWHEQRYASALARIATGHPGTEWKADPLNHSVEYWLPLGIAWVHGGNHSITAGILAGQGSLVAESVYDMTPLYRLIDTDGAFFFTSDGSIIATVGEVELAILFALGRFLCHDTTGTD